MKTFMTFLYIATTITFGYASTGGSASGAAGPLVAAPPVSESDILKIEEVTADPVAPITYVLDDAISKNTITGISLELRTATENESVTKGIQGTVSTLNVECSNVDLTCPAPPKGQPGNFSFFESFLNWQPNTEFSPGIPLATTDTSTAPALFASE